MKQHHTLPIIKDDPWLKPYEPAIVGRHQDAVSKEQELTQGHSSLADFANAHNYYGLHHKPDGGWVIREWAPNATAIYVVGQFNSWSECAPYKMQPCGTDGDWQLTLPEQAMTHGDLYKFHIHWQGGMGERIPAYATRVVQDEKTGIFSAQVWNPAHQAAFHI